jgi:hypothetical protein
MKPLHDHVLARLAILSVMYARLAGHIGTDLCEPLEANRTVRSLHNDWTGGGSCEKRTCKLS